MFDIFCCFLLFLSAAGCYWLLLAAAGCYWLLLAAAGCCWPHLLSLLLLVNNANVHWTAIVKHDNAVWHFDRRERPVLLSAVCVCVCVCGLVHVRTGTCAARDTCCTCHVKHVSREARSSTSNLKCFFLSPKVNVN